MDIFRKMYLDWIVYCVFMSSDSTTFMRYDAYGVELKPKAIWGM